jgi:hypothetical protein
MTLSIYYIEHKKKKQDSEPNTFHAYLSLVDESNLVRRRLEDIHFVNNACIQANLVIHQNPRGLKQRPQRLISGQAPDIRALWNRAKDAAKWLESISVPFDSERRVDSFNCRSATMGVLYALGLNKKVRNQVQANAGTGHPIFPFPQS